ncbi:MAG: acyl-CoA desaturase [Betaproteobacteria bacterium]|nr:acyl-CoA desaturase [Betaproteobacteria bacterium]
MDLEAFVDFLAYGVTGWNWLEIVVFTLVVTHITIAGVTIYLHRCQAHRAVELHPIVSHFFRFWMWLTTGMVTAEWASIHRKHHAKCETPLDPHSPQVEGLPTVMWQGADLYRLEAKNKETLERYSHGCPDDWIERNLYTKHSAMGVALMMVINVLLMGAAGVAVWAVQMMWIPFFAAGIINGVGHFWGYRNFKSPDASTNILPWGILIGGEELHNNHHSYATSPKLSAKWYEFDIGWAYIRTLQMLGLAKPRALPPAVQVIPAKVEIDAATIQAVLSTKYEQLARLSKAVSKDLNAKTSEMRDSFEAIWAQRSLTLEQAVAALSAWCQQAEASGSAALEQFAKRIRSLHLPQVTA